MLARLRHGTFVRGNHKERDVDAGGTSEHRPDKGLVPWDIHDAECANTVELEGRKAQFDRDAATLLLWQAVGVDAGEGAHERCLAVIDVPRGSENHRGAALAGAGRNSSQLTKARNARPSPTCSSRNSRSNRRCARALASSAIAASRPSSQVAMVARATAGSVRPPAARRAQAGQSAPPAR